MINPIEIVEFIKDFTIQEWAVLITLFGSFYFNYKVYIQNKDIAQNQNMYQNKQITADLICKARLDWMDKVRDLSAQWIYLIDEILKYDELEKVKEMLSELNLVSKQLSLCFNPENEQINSIKAVLLEDYISEPTNSKKKDKDLYDCITSVNIFIYFIYYNKKTDIIQKLQNNKQDILKEFDSNIRKYLKNEWERVKRFH